jgi:cytochrome c6
VPRDRDGFLTAQRLEDELGDLSSAHALICGPPAMIQSLKRQLVSSGIPSGQIQAEEFGFAKLDRTGLPEERWYDRPTLALVPALASAGVLVAAGLVFADWMASRDQDDRPRATVATRALPTTPDTDGKALFTTAGCDDCHALEAAGADGGIGPDLDEMKPDAALVREVVTNGKGAMPAFDDELTDEQIRSLATFVSTAAGK